MTQWGILCAGVLMLASCADTSTITCGDTVCPGGTTCVTLADPTQLVCATDEQLAACAGAADSHACSTKNIPSGRCYTGTCMPAVCGNGRVDRAEASVAGDVGEVCDDGDQQDGDGCSARCDSDETCGNGTIDVASGEICDDGNLIDHDRCTSRCQPESLGWSRVIYSDPPPLLGATAVYDSARHEVVMFGGDAGGSSNTTWIWDGEGWYRANTPVAPDPRTGHVMTYDSDRHRVVLFGGLAYDRDTGTDYLASDTWEWDGVRWTPVATATSPRPRLDAGMAYDAANHRTILYGGTIVPPVGAVPQCWTYGETWAFDGANWTQLGGTLPDPALPAPNGFCNRPVGRSKVSMTYAPGHGVVLFGGMTVYTIGANTVAAPFADNAIWTLGPTGWTKDAASSGPSARISTTMTYDTAGQRVLLHGGFDEMANQLDDLWAWNGTWSQITLPDPKPDGRSQHVLTAGPNGVILFGGNSQTSDTKTWKLGPTSFTAVQTTNLSSYNAVATLDTSRAVNVLVRDGGLTFERAQRSWRLVGNAGNVDFHFAITYDRTHQRTYFYATDGGTPFVKSWNGSQWSTVTAGGLPASTDAQLLYDAHINRLVWFGSVMDSAPTQTQCWTFDGQTWTQQTLPAALQQRSGASVGYDARDELVVVVAGSDSSGAAVDTWTWDGTSWKQIMVAPPVRDSAAITWSPNRARLVLFGGVGPQFAPLTDTWEWDGATWTIVPAALQPPGLRPQATLVSTPDGRALTLLGGGRSDVWELDSQGPGVSDACTDSIDLDGDGKMGCADPDCWYACSTCPPETSCNN